jgi:hypothetical protein
MATYRIKSGTMPKATLKCTYDPACYYSDKVRASSAKRARVWVCANSRTIAAEVAGTYRAMGHKGLVM